MKKTIQGYGTVSISEVASMNPVDIAELSVMVQVEANNYVESSRLTRLLVHKRQAQQVIYYNLLNPEYVNMVIHTPNTGEIVSLHYMHIDSLIAKADRLQANTLHVLPKTLQAIAKGTYFKPDYHKAYSNLNKLAKEKGLTR